MLVMRLDSLIGKYLAEQLEIWLGSLDDYLYLSKAAMIQIDLDWRKVK